MDVSPTKKLKVQIDFRDFWLVNLQDGLYNSGGTRTVFNTKASNSHVGEEIDAQAIVTLSKTTTLAVGVGSVFPGAYLEQSGKTSGFLYPFVWLSRKF